MYDIPNTACQYDNKYFDSKVEAKWAAYFDAVGLEWYREPDTFELKSMPPGQRIYTPDYYIANWDSYVEIKHDKMSWQVFDKMRYLARGIGKTVILLNGRPDNVFDGYVYSPEGTIGGNFPGFHDTGDFMFTHSQLLRGRNNMTEIIQQARFDCRDVEIRRSPLAILAHRAKQEKQELYDSRIILD